MKKAIVCLSISLIFLSCAKKYCWHCNSSTIYYNTKATNPDSTIVKTETGLDTVCNTTETDIRNYEVLHSDSTVEGNAIAVSATHCSK